MRKKIWFPVGILIALIAPLPCSTAVAPWHSGILNLAVPLIGLILGGAVAGYSLRRGVRDTLGFAIAFPVGLPLALLSVIGIQGMSGSEGFLSTLFTFCGSGMIAFGILAIVGTTISGLSWRAVAESAFAFGAGGAVSGAILAMALLLEQPGNRQVNQVLLLVGIGAFFLIPAILGGAALDRRIPPQSSSVQ